MGEGPQPIVVPVADLAVSPTASLFEGGELIGVSSFMTRHDPGEGPGLHVHPYPELFILEAGTARFTVGDEEHVVGAGHVVVVPAETPHGFKNAGEGPLRLISVHPSPAVEQTWLE